MIQKYWNSNRIKVKVEQLSERQRLVRHAVLVDLLKYCYDALFENVFEWMESDVSKKHHHDFG
ncbi:Chitin elicitor receptor kinase [Trichinella spiralis]|uniref:Chitin elicitor receptor kinase n=1 Tax=Trichinella spiralis TaxID=6334 RepID=A0ABR3KBG5_TRISP